MDGITMLGCRENNLKNIDITIPYGKIVSFIGVSGSGKSTLAFDTLYAEGKRRYIESLGINESFFLSKVKKPDADYFIGLPPTIALEQNGFIRNPRSTVGTISQAVYYVQLLFSSCSECSDESKMKTAMTPSMFNSNSPSGMCMECGGIGELMKFDETLIWPNQELSMAKGGLKLGGATAGTTKFTFMNDFLKQFGCDADTPVKNYPNELKIALLFGQKKNRKCKMDYPGIIPTYEKTYKTTKSLDVKEEIERFMIKRSCPCCGGTGFHPDRLNYHIDHKSIDDFMRMSIHDMHNLLQRIIFHDFRSEIYNEIASKLKPILKNCIDLGVGYLTLGRKAPTLSGGEMQRLRMVAQISSQLSGVVYVLDEPSFGMHASDIARLFKAIQQLNSAGNKNTIVMVEHTRFLINASDYVFEIGPGAGTAGGYIVAQGTPPEIADNKNSISGDYLCFKKTPGEFNTARDMRFDDSIIIEGANAHNLKNIDVQIPIHKFVCVTGVSGSGKTSLIFDSFYQTVQYHRNINVADIKGMENVDRVILCDQSPIGNSSKSCPATYSGAFSYIRKLFAGTPEAKKAKLTEKHFSFNSKEGRCEKCCGEGVIKINMGFMPEMTVVCEECGGKRYKEKVLKIRYKERNIHDILELTVSEAMEVFRDSNPVFDRLEAINRVGLSYIKLGQHTNTLSGGELQRLKLAYELRKPCSYKTLIIFDEPSKGLHFEDVKRLLGIMKEMVLRGVSVLAVEHNLDVISSADYIIDIGPYGGEAGGKICGQGTPLQISELNTPTGKELKKLFSMMKNKKKPDICTADTKQTGGKKSEGNTKGGF